jgi:hypothetical protein
MRTIAGKSAANHVPERGDLMHGTLITGARGTLILKGNFLRVEDEDGQTAFVDINRGIFYRGVFEPDGARTSTGWISY